MAAGRVTTGFSKPYVAKYTNNGSTVTYSNGMRLARGVSVEIDPEASDDNKFYCDNQTGENAAGTFAGGTVTLTVDGLFMTAERLIMGLPEAKDGWTDYGDDQSVPYVGIGAIRRFMSDGVTGYTPFILTKTIFSAIPTSAETQEDEIDWQTQELTATLNKDDTAKHVWKKIGEDQTSEEAAEDMIKEFFNITDEAS